MIRFFRNCAFAFLGGVNFALAQITATGTALLTWDPPTQYVNGEPLSLSNIQKYTIYWGTSPDDLSNSVDVNNGAVQSRQIDLTVTQPTTFYFAVSAWANDMESDLSNIASKLIEFESGSVGPGAPQNVTLEITMTCEDSRPGTTCQVIVQ